MLYEALQDASGGASTRRETLDEVRSLLLTDRSVDGDDTPLHLVQKRELSERTLAAHLHRSRIPIREALTVLRTLGVVSVPENAKRYQVTLLVGPNGVVENKHAQLRRNIRCELFGNGASALARLVEATDSAEDRHKRLEPLWHQLACAEERSKANSIRDRGDAVLCINDAVAGLATAAGLHWASDAIRSGLDIIEISSKFAQEPLEDQGADPFPSERISDRVGDCRAIFERLECTEDRDQAVESAQSAFQAYVDNRFAQLDEHLSQVSCPDPGRLGEYEQHKAAPSACAV